MRYQEITYTSDGLGSTFTLYRTQVARSGLKCLEELACKKREREICCSNPTLNISEARKWGSVNRVVRDAKLVEPALNLEFLIADRGAFALASPKAVANARDEGVSALSRMANGRLRCVYLKTKEHEALAACIAKNRSPNTQLCGRVTVYARLTDAL